MRVPMVFQWLRAGRQDPARRAVCRRSSSPSWSPRSAGCCCCSPTRRSRPVFVARGACWSPSSWPGRSSPRRCTAARRGTAHHIAERYGLMVIIALGEGLLGTTAALGALIEDGWTLEVAVLGLAGTALIFGVWWTYFVVPSRPAAERPPRALFGWGYGHIPLFGAVVAIGAGLHAAAYYLDDAVRRSAPPGPCSRWRSRWRSTSPASTCSTPLLTRQPRPVPRPADRPLRRRCSSCRSCWPGRASTWSGAWPCWRWCRG